MSKINPKQLYKTTMKTAIENFLTAKKEGAQQSAPYTYAWAKAKIYQSKKTLLLYPDDEKKVQEASDEASAAAARLLALVREKQQIEENTDQEFMGIAERAETEAIKIFVNEGGLVE